MTELSQQIDTLRYWLFFAIALLAFVLGAQIAILNRLEFIRRELKTRFIPEASATAFVLAGLVVLVIATIKLIASA